MGLLPLFHYILGGLVIQSVLVDDHLMTFQLSLTEPFDRVILDKFLNAIQLWPCYFA